MLDRDLSDKIRTSMTPRNIDSSSEELTLNSSPRLFTLP